MDQILPVVPARALQGGGPAPLRRPGSVRRTTSIDAWWPAGRGGACAFEGRSRDVLTGWTGALEVLDQQQVSGQASLQREIASLYSTTCERDLSVFVGLRAGGQLRSKLRERMSDQCDTALYLLLDDLAGATLVSNWAWFAWEGYSEALANMVRGADISGWNGSMRGICIGLRDGSSALDVNGFPKMEEQFSVAVAELIYPSDPEGWHNFPVRTGPSMRRARWIDIFNEGEFIVAECGFQDSAARADGGRQAVHEYHLRATIDGEGRLASVAATPHVLPHAECPAAVLNLHRLVGSQVSELRNLVPQKLAKEDGCTHLNDVMRAIAASPMLAGRLRALSKEEHDSHG